MDKIPNDLKQPLIDLLLSVADDKLMLGHRNSDWTGLAPNLEADIAFSSIAQDEIAHAGALYEMIASLTGDDADRVAYGREPTAYRCAAIVEAPDEFNWAVAIVRQFYCDHFDHLRLRRLAGSTYRPLAELAARLAAEEAIHVQHADSWLRRLACGDQDARGRIQQALEALAAGAMLLFEPTDGLEQLEAAGVYPHGETDMYDAWTTALETVARDAGLTLMLDRPPVATHGGRRGVHGPDFPALLDELGEVYRLEPDAAW